MEKRCHSQSYLFATPLVLPATTEQQLALRNLARWSVCQHHLFATVGALPNQHNRSSAPHCQFWVLELIVDKVPVKKVTSATGTVKSTQVPETTAT